jgi:hypothetical protein
LRKWWEERYFRNMQAGMVTPKYQVCFLYENTLWDFRHWYLFISLMSCTLSMHWVQISEWCRCHVVLIESEEFWRSCIALRITGFLDFFPSSRILNNQKEQCFGNWTCFRPQVRRERHLLCGVPQKELISITGLTEDSSFYGTQRSRCLPLLAWRRKQIQFPKKKKCVF